jgi:hypothetical protein
MSGSNLLRFAPTRVYASRAAACLVPLLTIVDVSAVRAQGVPPAEVKRSPAPIATVDNWLYRITANACPGGRSHVQSAFAYEDRSSGQAVTFLMTALHGVIGCSTLFAEHTTRARARTQVKLIALDAPSDVARLAPIEGSLEGPGLMLGGDLNADAKYCAYGYPNGANQSLRRCYELNPDEPKRLGDRIGAINDADYAAFKRRNSPSLDHEVMTVLAPLISGDSGGPIVEAESSRVVGVVVAGYKPWGAMAWATPTRGLTFTAVEAVRPDVLNDLQQSVPGVLLNWEPEPDLNEFRSWEWIVMGVGAAGALAAAGFAWDVSSKQQTLHHMCPQNQCGSEAEEKRYHDVRQEAVHSRAFAFGGAAVAVLLPGVLLYHYWVRPRWGREQPAAAWGVSVDQAGVARVTWTRFW